MSLSLGRRSLTQLSWNDEGDNLKATWNTNETDWNQLSSAFIQVQDFLGQKTRLKHPIFRQPGNHRPPLHSDF